MRTTLILMITLLISSCSDTRQGEEEGKTAPDHGGSTLAQRYLIVDTHIDTPYKLFDEYKDISQRVDLVEFDYPRAIAGGLDVAFMSIYIPAAVDEAGNARERADTLIDMVEEIVAEHPDKFALAPDTAAVRKNSKSGKVTLAMGMENGGPIEGNLENVQYFYDRGIRYITLAHSKSNHISDSSYDDNRQWGGLSEFGKQLVPEMNRTGIMVDVSHLSDEAFYDVLDATHVPVIASHSSARHFIPGFERNMSDDMIRALADNGGVIQLNMGSTFISQASRESNEARNKLVDEYIEEQGIEPDSPEAEEVEKRIYAENLLQYATLEDGLDHIDHIVSLAGIEHVGIGSDFDGVGDTLPIGFKDVSDFPALVDGLLDRGYSKGDIRKILGENLMRVWRQTEAFARMSRAASN